MNRPAIVLTLWLFASAQVCLAQTPTADATPPVPSQPAPSPPSIDPGVAPFITHGTLFVAQVDPDRIDAGAIQDWIAAGQQGNGANAAATASANASQRAQAKQWLSDFHKAGGTKVFAVAFFGDPSTIPGVVIVPLAPGADAKAICGLLVTGKPDGPDHVALPGDPSGGVEAVVMQNAVVFGLTPQVEKEKLAIGVDRPEFAAALAALGDQPLKIAFVPSIALQLVAGEMLPEKLPDQLGGGSPVPLVTSLDWAAIGIAMPPQGAIEVRVQCKDAQGAQAFGDLCVAALSNPPPDAVQAGGNAPLAALKPVLKDNLLSLDIDSAAMDAGIRPMVINLINSHKSRAQQTQSMSNEHMLMIGVEKYAAENKGEFPKTLADIAPYMGGGTFFNIAMKSPSDPNKSPGFGYVKPQANWMTLPIRPTCW